jgi:hypothetical protein
MEQDAVTGAILVSIAVGDGHASLRATLEVDVLGVYAGVDDVPWRSPWRS